MDILIQKVKKYDADKNVKIDRFIYSIENGEDEGCKRLSKTCLICNNLRKSIKHLDNQKSEINDTVIIEMESSLLYTHKLLMNGLISNAGKLSTNRRITYYQGEIYEYPRMISMEISYDTIFFLLDIINDDIYKAFNICSEIKCMEMLIKTACKFMYVFLTLHPMSDGNGRLSRLLCNHIVSAKLPIYWCLPNVTDILVSLRYDFNKEITSSIEGKTLVLELLNNLDLNKLYEYVLNNIIV